MKTKLQLAAALAAALFFTAGGVYRLRAYQSGNPEETFVREITVQQSVLPRLRMELEFERKAFGPGDEVTARLDLHTLDNRPMADQEFALFGPYA